MKKCLKSIFCCIKNNKEQNQSDNQNKGKLKDFQKCYIDDKQKTFTFKGDTYQVQEQIGQGAFSEVYTVFNQNKKRFEVLKKLILKESIDEYIQEYNILRSIKHEFIIQFYDCLLLDDDLCFLMEYAEQGTLQQFIDNPYLLNKKVDANFILEICESIFEGIQYLQIKKIIHRDLKPENILISNFKAKIADLGLSKFLLSKFANTNVGNILYAAPEKNNNDKGGYGLKSDIYSAGLILCQVLLKLTASQISQINFFDNQNSLKNVPDDINKLISKLISKNPDERPSCEIVIQQINSFKQNKEIKQYINSKYQLNSSIIKKQDISISGDQNDIEKQCKLEQPLIIGEAAFEEKDSVDFLSSDKLQINFGVDSSQNQVYKPENEQWFEQNFTAGAVSIIRFKDLEKAIKQFEKILNVEVRDEFMVQKKLMMILWMMRKRNYTLENLFDQQKSEQDYRKAKDYAQACLQLDPLNQNCLSILALSMIKLRHSEIEILIQIEKIISKIYFGGLLLFMTLIDIQKYIHPSYSKSNSAHVKNKNKDSDHLLNEQSKKSSSSRLLDIQIIVRNDLFLKGQVQETNQINKEEDDENQFKHFSDYVKKSSKAQKDFIIQFMEINDLEQYQARFLFMSLLAVFTVALCCFGVKYILNFSKTCKTALSEIKWIKEVEAQQEQQQQNVFTEY